MWQPTNSLYFGSTVRYRRDSATQESPAPPQTLSSQPKQAPDVTSSHLSPVDYGSVTDDRTHSILSTKGKALQRGK